MDALLDVLWRVGRDRPAPDGGHSAADAGAGRARPGARPSALTGQDTDALLAGLLTFEQASTWDLSREYDFSFSWRDLARVRGNAFSQRGRRRSRCG